MRHSGAAIAIAVATASLALLALAGPASSNHSLQELVSTGPAGGNGAFDASPNGLSDDGLHAFFVTSESLVPSDIDGRQDVYERFGGTTTLVSTGPAGGNGPFDAIFDASSSDGSRVIFTTNEPLVSADTDNQYDVYQRSGGVTTLLSTGPTGGNGAFAAFFEGASADASHVFFTTDEALTSGDIDARLDVYESSGGTTSLVSAGGNGDFDALYEGASKDGTQVFFRTYEKLAATDTDAYPDIYKRAAGATTEISLGSGTTGNGLYAPLFAGVSNDGSRVFFTTREKLDPADTDGGCIEVNSTVPCTDVYQRSGTTTTLISTGPTGTNGTFDAQFAGASSDGAHVFFTTAEPLTSSDTDSKTDVYDRSGTTTTLVSTGPTGGNGAVAASFNGSSSDGAHVFFSTSESLVSSDSDGRQDVYDRFGGATTIVSSGPPGGNGPFDASFQGASADGSRVFFHTKEPLVASDTDSRQDVYEWFAGTTTLVSTGPLDTLQFDASLSRTSVDGTRVLFRTKDQLLAGDTDSSQDVYTAIAIPYDHPQSASTLTVALVPSFRQTIDATQCSSRGGAPSMHGAPLSLNSCNPPNFVPGTQAHFGPQSSGSAQLTVVPGNPATTADEADVSVAVALSDLRAGSSAGSDYNPSPAGPDLTLAVRLRISDLLNGPSLGQPATVSDVELQAPVDCTTTAGPAGSDCNAATTADAVTPGIINERKASVLAAFRVRLNDSGSNNVRGDSDDRNFAMQGFYVP